MYNNARDKADNADVDKLDIYKQISSGIKQNNLRAIDMQQVVGSKLAANQQAVNNAENYPSTWTTNPDGGANGQV